MRRLLITTVLAAALAPAACKTPSSGSGLRDAGVSERCPLGNTWAGRMGMRLSDAGSGARIDCVVVGQGLHHIGLREGDVIVALNDGTEVSGASGFEQAATQLAGRSDRKRIQRWEFTVNRGGQNVAVVPPKEYPACGIFMFDDCGPLNQ